MKLYFLIIKMWIMSFLLWFLFQNEINQIIQMINSNDINLISEKNIFLLILFFMISLAFCGVVLNTYEVWQFGKKREIKNNDILKRIILDNIFVQDKGFAGVATYLDGDLVPMSNKKYKCQIINGYYEDFRDMEKIVKKFVDDNHNDFIFNYHDWNRLHGKTYSSLTEVDPLYIQFNLNN